MGSWGSIGLDNPTKYYDTCPTPEACEWKDSPPRPVISHETGNYNTYGNFDIIFGPFLAHFSAPPHPKRTVGCTPRRAYTGRVLIGVWNPML